MSDLLTIRVVGIPGAQGSKRHVGHGILKESSKKVAPWRTDVKTAAEAALTQQSFTMLDGPVHVSITFRFLRPKGHYRTGRNAHLLRDGAPTIPTSRGLGDIDKLVRSTFDALTTAGVVTDDSLFAQLYTEKVWCVPGQPAGATIVVGSLLSPLEQVPA